MTEAEWLSSEDPGAMLSVLTGDAVREHVGPRGLGSTAGRLATASPRKLRLFACACCRQVWHLLTDPRSRRAVEVAEQRADGLLTPDEQAEASYNAIGVNFVGPAAVAWAVCGDTPEESAVWAVSEQVGSPVTQAALLRDIFGNPFRPAPSEPYAECAGGVVPTDRDDNTCPCCHGTGRRFPRRWLTPTVLRLARGVYADRDFGAMPVLADALEEAGCEDGPLLRHLRGHEPCAHETHRQAGGDYWCPSCGGTEEGSEGWMPLRGPHVAGCWALDFVLGKE